MTKLLLHIGLQKTGTTFLQQNFLGRAARLRDVGMHYVNPRGNLPTEKVSAAHHWLVAAIRGISNTYIPDVPFSFLPDYVAAVHQKIARGTYPFALMSSENFSRMNDAEVAMLRALFKGIDTEIVIYLRRQDVWIDSWYAQMVKTGRKVQLEDAIDEMTEFLDYQNLLTRWGNSFGQENIRLGIYENLDEPLNLWADFFNLVGCPEAGEVKLQEQTANVTLAKPLTKFIEIAQQTTGYNPMLRRFLEAVNTQFARDKSLKFLSTAQAEQILDRHAASNTKIAQTYLGRDQLFQDMDVLGNTREDDSLQIEDLVNVVAGTNIAMLKRLSAIEKTLAEIAQAGPQVPPRKTRRKTTAPKP